MNRKIFFCLHQVTKLKQIKMFSRLFFFKKLSIFKNIFYQIKLILLSSKILLAILGFHSMMNQDQYHASLLNKGQPVGLGWDGITKASKQKIFPVDPPNMTDTAETIKKVEDDESKFIDLNWNNIKVSLLKCILAEIGTFLNSFINFYLI